MSQELVADRALLSSLPGGRSALTYLLAATDEAASADGDYVAWVDDLQATGCYGGPTTTSTTGTRSAPPGSRPGPGSSCATAWAPIASRYKVPAWHAGQI